MIGRLRNPAPLSTRYSSVGVGALALLSIGHWARAHAGGGAPAYSYALGVLPSFLAAIAVPFVVLGTWADHKPDATPAAARRWFPGIALVSTAGLVGWEVLQRGSTGLIFDAHDIGATLVGLGAATILFRLVTPALSRAAERGAAADGAARARG